MSVSVKILGLKDNHSPDQVIEQVAIHYKRDTQEFRQNLKAAIGNPQLAQPLLQKLDQEAADQAVQILGGFGLVCEAEEEVEFSLELEAVEKNHICPACNHEQPFDENGEDVCQECGVVASKFSGSAKQKIYEEEKQKLATKESHQKRDTEKQQAALEEENLRNTVRAQLGLEKKSRKNTPAIALAFVAIAAAGGYIATQTELLQSIFPADEAIESVANEKTQPGTARVTMATLQAKASAAASTGKKGGVVSDEQRVNEIMNLVATLPEPVSGEGSAEAVGFDLENSVAANEVSTEDYLQAFTTAESISDPQQKSIAIKSIAESATSQVHSNESLELFEKEFRGYSYAGTEKLGHQIVSAWLNRIDVEHAYQSALQFRDEYQKSEAVRTIIQWEVANLEQPDFEKALQALDAISKNLKDPQELAHLLSTMSYIYKFNGQENKSEEYLDLAFHQSDLALRVDHKIVALSRIGEDRLALHDTELGLHIFDNIKNMANGLSKYNPAKGRSFKTIAISLANSGNFLDAQLNIGEIHNEEIRHEALIEVAQIATDANKPEIAAILLDKHAETVLIGRK